MIPIGTKTFNLRVSEKFIFLKKKAKWFTTKIKMDGCISVLQLRAIQLSVFLIIFAEASRATRNTQAKTLAPTAKSL